jgi:hypothetical protein
MSRLFDFLFTHGKLHLVELFLWSDALRLGVFAPQKMTYNSTHRTGDLWAHVAHSTTQFAQVSTAFSALRVDTTEKLDLAGS